MSTVVIERLREALRGEPKPLIICGAGVSVHASGETAPSWAKLVGDGVDRAEGIDPKLHAWAEWARHRLRNEGAASWIEVADELTTRLGGQHNAEFLEFLEEKVGSLELRDTGLVEALLRLECPLATTNYDDLLSRASGQPVVNWTDSEEVARCLSGQWKGIIHLHGHWRKPETVVLGTRSYNQLVSDERSRLIGQMAALTRPTVFVGCSFDGISDPDFADLDRFIGNWQSASQPRFVLIKAGGDTAPQLERRLYPVVYGDSHDDLVPFLEQLSAGPAAATNAGPTAPVAALRCIDKRVPKPDLFGRDMALADIVEATSSGRSVIIAGGPGIGKTALAVATLYDDGLKARYKENRVFVSLDEAVEPRALLARLAGELGLPAAGDEVSLLRSIEIYTAAQGVLAILDNAELVFENQRAEAERLLRLASQVDGLTFILTIRGTAPHLPGAFVIDDLAQLEAAAAREAFLASAGPGFAGDPDLADLVNALDGHALSIQLVAAQASGIPRLKPLLEAWEEQHAEMLVRHDDAEETRSTSLRASLALSVESQRMKAAPLSKRLLSILAYLPAGLDETEASRLLGSPGTVNRTKAAGAVATLHKLRLVERRLDGRLRMLNPLREGARLLAPIGTSDKRRLVDKFVKIARQADFIGTDAWPRVRHLVEAERGNLDYVCLVAARQNIEDSRVQLGLWGYGELVKFIGGGDITSLEFAAEEAQRRGLWSCAPKFLFQLGNIRYGQMDFEAAANYYNRGNILASKDRTGVSSAQFLQGLGRISFANSDHENAERRFQEALIKAKGSPLTEANIVSYLAEIRLRRFEYDEAAILIDRARSLYMDETIGMANILRFLAELRPGEATDLLTRAVELCGRIGSPGTQGGIKNRLGRLKMAEFSYEEAIEPFSEALALARGAAKIGVEAESLLLRGRAKLQLGDPSGQNEVDDGMDLFLRVSSRANRALPGWMAFKEAVTSRDEGVVTRARQAAGDEWKRVERLDLVRDYANGLFPDSTPVS